jgi:hypothetical protein
MIRLFSLHRRLFVLLSFVLFVAIYAFYQEKVARINYLDYWGWTDQQKEAFFEHVSPTPQDIENALKNTTILSPHLPSENSITYFGDNDTFIRWSGIYLYRGVINYDWKIEPIIYKGRWKIRIEYSFCHTIPDMSAISQSENCVGIYNIEQILKQWGPAPQQRPDDVFGLSKMSDPPFAMPIGPIDYESIARMIESNERK